MEKKLSKEQASDFYTRAYQPGDEIHINRLYKKLTGMTRSVEQYKWEWTETWDGVGTIFLMFDRNRPENDQLACQYSLIPVPFQFFNKSISCGKTENCMSHPAFRGKGIFFPHEKKYFEEAKKRHQLFFTTTGKGAPGKVRRKVGYKALDYWVEFFYIPSFRVLREYIWSNYFRKIGNGTMIRNTAVSIVSTLVSVTLWLYISFKSIFSTTKKAGKTVFFTEENAPLEELEQLWKENKEKYGITVDRKADFLNWRFNQNPYFDHKYLTIYLEGRLKGYLIYHINKNDFLHIVDVLVDRSSEDAFHGLIRALIEELNNSLELKGIVCGALKGNDFLSSSFKNSLFLKKDFSEVKNRLSKNPLEKPFYVYAAPELPDYERAYDPHNWYITDIVKEGIQ